MQPEPLSLTQTEVAIIRGAHRAVRLQALGGRSASQIAHTTGVHPEDARSILKRARGEHGDAAVDKAIHGSPAIRAAVLLLAGDLGCSPEDILGTPDLANRAAAWAGVIRAAYAGGGEHAG